MSINYVLTLKDKLTLMSPFAVPIIAIVLIILIIWCLIRIFLPAKDATVGDWHNKGVCSESCGVGVQVEERDYQPALHGGKDIQEDNTRKVSCKITDCPIDGTWGDWVGNECNAPCGLGKLIQTRTCNEPQYGGKPCTGPTTESVISCESKPCPIHGEYGPWQSGTCSVSCNGGVQKEERLCNSPAPAYGGLGCEGDSSRMMTCNTQACPIDSKFSDWLLTSQCSTECGGGKLYEVREKSLPQNGGLDIQGDTKRVSNIACNDFICPEECDKLQPDPDGQGYPLKCYEYWWAKNGCTNKNYIKNQLKDAQLTGVNEGGLSFWAKQSPQVVKDDMKLWASADVNHRFKSFCLPEGYQPLNSFDCKQSNSSWDSIRNYCDVTRDKKGVLKEN